MPAWRKYEISTYTYTYGMSNMYEAIIIKKIILQDLKQEMLRISSTIMLYYFRSPWFENSFRILQTTKCFLRKVSLSILKHL